MKINSCFLLCRCDADPSALANYVVALVKKDKSEKELRALCADQLDVFLQKGNAALNYTIFRNPVWINFYLIQWIISPGY